MIQAINKFWRKGLDCGKRELKDVDLGTDEEMSLLEELADVKIMIEQMEYLLIADLDPIIEQKLNRQIERIEGK